MRKKSVNVRVVCDVFYKRLQRCLFEAKICTNQLEISPKEMSQKYSNAISFPVAKFSMLNRLIVNVLLNY